MLKFLTHKLRTHSLNEDTVAEKVEERDSGTESDDEAEHPDTGDFCTDVIMKWNDVTDISMATREVSCECPPPAPPPDDQLYDHHSSEEELEVINASGAASGSPSTGARRRGASSPPAAAPGKRKWPRHESDDDDTKVETPVRFRTSPPLEALKPWRGAVCPSACPPVCPAVCCALPSPRRRRAPPPHTRRHRPALDFDKMQQLKVMNMSSGGGMGSGGGVRAWRGAGTAQGELSVFCW